ncbi:unnamed protein product [Brassica rapa subsp. trilocularis]
MVTCSSVIDQVTSTRASGFARNLLEKVLQCYYGDEDNEAMILRVLSCKTVLAKLKKASVLSSILMSKQV